MKTNAQHDEWYKLYRDKVSVCEIARRYGVHKQTVYSAFYRRDKDVCVGMVNRKYREDFFDVVDTDEKAYVLGLIMADGCVSRKNTVTIKLQIGDADLLKQISQILSPGYETITYEKNTAVYHVYSKVLSARIAELLRYKKTETMEYPKWLSPEMHGAFIRGVFDGDGSIGVRTARKRQMQINICSISEKFLSGIQRVLTDAGVTSCMQRERRVGKKTKMPQGFATCLHDMYRLVFSSHAGRVALFEFMYSKSTTLCMRRKFVLYKTYYDNAVRILAVKKPFFTDEQYRAFHARHLAGESVRSIARSLDVSNTMLFHNFKRLGLNRIRVTRRS